MFLRSLDDACSFLEPAIVVVECDGRVGTGFFVGAPGVVVTALHLVADATVLRLRLPNGRRLAVDEVLGVDVRRNLAVLKTAAHGTALSLWTAEDAVPEGRPLFAQASPGDTTGIVQTRSGATEKVGDHLKVCLMPGLAADTAGGSPLVDGFGQVLGVVTRVLSNVGPLAVGVPAVHLVPLVTATEVQRLAALQVDSRRRKAVKRSVPTHPSTLLDGSSADGIEAIGAGIVAAIQTGAPAYNEGDIEGCYRVYEEAARRLLQERDDCPGPQRALRDGLTRAAALGEDVNAQAWAMRDAFDGLLLVIEKWNEAKSALVLAAPKRKTILN